MARSYRKPSYFVCNGADPATGKRVTSRYIRHRVKQELRNDGADFDFVDIRDKNRGNSGSKNINDCWDYFGDGKAIPERVRIEHDGKTVSKLSRK